MNTRPLRIDPAEHDRTTEREKTPERHLKVVRRPAELHFIAWRPGIAESRRVPLSGAQIHHLAQQFGSSRGGITGLASATLVAPSSEALVSNRGGVSWWLERM
jgi:hypothetical protein